MIRLHLLGFTPDLKGLVFSGRRGGRTGTYWLPVDGTLERALSQLEKAREDQAREKAGSGKGKGKAKAKGRKETSDEPDLDLEGILAGAEEPPSVTDTQDLPLPSVVARSESRLPPREIQQLLRQGRSVRDVAAEAGVDERWVERFTGPVLEEMIGVIRMTREAFQTRPRLGVSGLPIGTAVLRNLTDRKATADTLAEAEDGWEARHVAPRTWRVRLRFRHRGKRRTAEWEFNKDGGEVRPRNKLATELGWWPPPGTTDGSATTAQESEEPGEEAPPRRRAPAKRKAAKRKAAKRKPAKRKPAAKRKTPAKRKPAAKKKTAKKAVKKKTAKKPAPKRGGRSRR